MFCRMAQYTIGKSQSADGAVSEQVVSAVAAACDIDPLELPPLYDVIDPDALDRLFEHGALAEGNSIGRVTFTMAGCEVVVHSDGAVDATAPGDRSPTSSAKDRVGKQNPAESTLD